MWQTTKTVTTATAPSTPAPRKPVTAWMTTVTVPSTKGSRPPSTLIPTATGTAIPASTTQACSAPSGYVANDDDCDDSDSAVNPGASEICNGVDDDCDTQIDEGCNFLVHGMETAMATATLRGRLTVPRQDMSRKTPIVTTPTQHQSRRHGDL